MSKLIPNTGVTENVMQNLPDSAGSDLFFTSCNRALIDLALEFSFNLVKLLQRSVLHESRDKKK